MVIVAIMLSSLCAVCATTGVAATDNSKAPSQAPSLVGAQMPSGAAVVACGEDKLFIFAKGANNALYWKSGTPSTNTWSDWKSLGGRLTSDPAAASPYAGPMPDQRINVYVRGTDGALWEISTTNGGLNWGSWTKIGGYIAKGTGPAACVARTDPGEPTYTYDTAAFVTGGDHALWWYFVHDSVWSWKRIGGYATSSPSAAGTGQSIYAFVRGTDGALWEYEFPYDTSVIVPWIKLGGYILPGTSPAASDCYVGALVVFVNGGDSALWYKMPTATGSWSQWQSLGGRLTSSPTSTQGIEPPENPPALNVKAYVFVRGTDGALWWIKGFTAWSSWKSLGGM